MALLDTLPGRASALTSLLCALAFAVQPASADQDATPKDRSAQIMAEASSSLDTDAAAHAVERHISAEIIRRFKQRAEAGDLEALIVLGHVYETGRGVAQDFVLAHKWYNLAEAYGHRSANLLRDEVASNLTAAQVVEAQRMALEWLVMRQTAQTDTAANEVAF